MVKMADNDIDSRSALLYIEWFFGDWQMIMLRSVTKSGCM